MPARCVEPRERRHERVLDRPLPALPGHRLGEELEDDPEVRPDDRADQQRRRGPVDVDLPPVASTPSAMKTIVSVFATVQRKNATSHQK